MEKPQKFSSATLTGYENLKTIVFFTCARIAVHIIYPIDIAQNQRWKFTCLTVAYKIFPPSRTRGMVQNVCGELYGHRGIF